MAPSQPQEGCPAFQSLKTNAPSVLGYLSLGVEGIIPEYCPSILYFLKQWQWPQCGFVGYLSDSLSSKYFTMQPHMDSGLARSEVRRVKRRSREFNKIQKVHIPFVSPQSTFLQKRGNTQTRSSTQFNALALPSYPSIEIHCNLRDENSRIIATTPPSSPSVETSVRTRMPRI